MNARAATLVGIVVAFLLIPPALARQADDNPPMDGFNLEASDAKAIDIADAVMHSMGGRANWDQTRYLSWGFGRDDQLWDKWTGQFRFQRDSLVVLMNVVSKEGQAWHDGQEITDATALDEHLARAYRAWVNSSYWLLMPYKLKDSGVTLRYRGEGTMEDGRPAEILELTFDSVGLTPQNKYHVYVDKETMLVGQWSYFRDAADAEPQFTRPWKNWQRYGAVMLSNHRGEGRGGNPFILPNVGVYDTVPASAFEDPARLDLATLADQ